MPLSKFEYSKNWENSEDFPSFEPDEAKVRADLQLLFDEARDAINKLAEDIVAKAVPFQVTPEINASNVQSAIEYVQNQIASTVLGDLPDYSVTTVKLVDSVITEEKLSAESVTREKIKDGEVVESKLADASVSTRALVDGSVTGEKLSADALSGKADLVGGRVSAEQLVGKVKYLSQGMYTLTAEDTGATLVCLSDNAKTIIIPDNASVGFPVGTEVHLIQDGGGLVTIQAAEGVTLKSKVTCGEDECIRLTKTSANNWHAEKAITVVRTPDLTDGCVTSAKISDDSVTTDKLADGSITAGKIASNAVKLSYMDVTIGKESFVEDSKYEDYPFCGTATISDASASMLPEVIFAVDDAGNFAPVAESFDGGVRVYAAEKPDNDVVIPTLVCWR